VIEDDAVPLTNAPDDSEYVAEPDKTDVEFLRQEAAYQISSRNMEVGNRLSEIADRLEALEDRAGELQQVFDLRWSADRRATKRWQEAHPESDLVWPDHADLVLWLMERSERAPSDFRGRGQPATLELTKEMQLPPDFRPSPLRLWEVENNRDLVAELRGEIRNARENGHDVLRSYTDHQLLCDLLDSVDGYHELPEEVMLEAIAEVRRLEQTDVKR
jgi:hypothetical protein